MNSGKGFAARLQRFKMGPTGGQKERSQRNNYKVLLYKNSLHPYFKTSFESILSVSGLALHKDKIWDIVKRKKLELFLIKKPILWRASRGETDTSHLKIHSITKTLKTQSFSVSKKINYFQSCQSQHPRKKLK